MLKIGVQGKLGWGDVRWRIRRDEPEAILLGKVEVLFHAIDRHAHNLGTCTKKKRGVVESDQAAGSPQKKTREGRQKGGREDPQERGGKGDAHEMQLRWERGLTERTNALGILLEVLGLDGAARGEIARVKVENGVLALEVSEFVVLSPGDTSENYASR